MRSTATNEGSGQHALEQNQTLSKAKPDVLLQSPKLQSDFPLAIPTECLPKHELSKENSHARPVR